MSIGSICCTVMGLLSWGALSSGAEPLAVQDRERRARAISAKELNTGGLDEDGLAAAALNQLNGGGLAARFLLPPVTLV